MAVLLLVAGLVITGLALGFLLAVSLGIRSRDRKGGYRSLRDDSEGGPLAATGQRVVGPAFPEDPPPQEGLD